MDNLTEMQHRLVTSSSKIIIAANSRGVGHTTGLILRSIFDLTTTSVKFYQPTYKLLSLVIDNTINVLESLGLSYKVNRSLNFIVLSSGKRINFCLPEDENTCHWSIHYKKNIGNTLVILDQVDFFEQYFIDYQIELQKHNGNTLMFSTQPYLCGWRDIKTDYGYPVLNDNGVPETVNQSWDYDLIDWAKLGIVTRAKPKDYKQDVEVIHSYGFNPYLEEENKNYSKFMSTLPLAERIRLDGVWKKGMKLVGNKE